MSLFSNAEVDRVSNSGGVVGIVVSDSATQATTVPTPCRECYVSYCPSTATIAGNMVHFAINTSLTVSLGATLPKSIPANSLGPGSDGSLKIPIDDVSKLWFYSIATAAKVGITYRT